MNKLQDSLASLSISTDRSVELRIKYVENYSQFNDRIYMNVYDMKRYKLSALDFVALNSHLFRCWPDLECKPEGCAIINKGLPISSKETQHCSIIRQQDLDRLPIAASITISSAQEPLKETTGSSEPEKIVKAYVREYLLEVGFVFGGQEFLVDCPGKFASKIVVDLVEGGEQVEQSAYFSFSRETKILTKSLAPSKRREKIELGGLEAQIQRIVELICLPERLKDLSVPIDSAVLSAPKGILLFGPPGTGKTLLARKIALDLNYAFFPIDGSDISSKFYGESEEKLKRVFEEAAFCSPAIIFIDELDCLCPKREESYSAIERRIVACLLTLMDGINAKDSFKAAGSEDRLEEFEETQSTGDFPVEKRVFVIAATNRPDSLDRALRRPGRFDKEIEIPIPSAEGRVDILRTIIRNSIPQPHLELTDQDIEFVAAHAHGYVGADLAALCRESLLHCLANSNCREAQEISKGSSLNSIANLLAKENFVLKKHNLLYGLTIVKPSAMREITAQIPSTYWSDIGGQHATKQALKECVEWPLVHRAAFQRMGIDPPKGVLLYGPPGCSKTLMAKALATEARLNFISVKGPELFNKWFGESERAVKEVFRKARAASPSIIFFDEIDAIGSKRDSSGTGENSVQDRVLSMLLNEMDGIEPLINVTIVGATNRPDAMDAALLRPGRFDRLIYVSPPDSEARAEIFRIQSRRMPFSNQIDIAQLVTQSDGYSGAEIVSLCQEAAINALGRDVQTEHVEARDFEVAFTKVRKGITPEMIDFYEQFRNK